MSGGFLLLVLNYFLIVRKAAFLKRGFKKSTKGTLLVIIYILITVFFAITVASFNRSKLDKKRLAYPLKSEHIDGKSKTQKSLEGRGRK